MSFGEAQPVDIYRPLTDFTPSIWGDYFMAYASKSMEMDNTNVVETVIELKKEVKNMIDADAARNTPETLDLIDAVQRLGLACHFEKEIEATLQKLYKNILGHHCEDQVDNGDIYTVALRFRLLRQQGYHIPCDIFRKFMDNEGKFKESLVNDVRGMLSLYEASHLRVHEEDILDEALIFTTTHFKFIASNSSSPLSDQVIHALKHPIRKSMPRREARRYLSVYAQDDSHNEALLTLAKLDFNQLQERYKKELSELTGWWKDFDSRTKLLSFSRDRIVECFFWAMGIFYEAKFSFARTIMAKLVAVLTIIDDIYDSFGTIAELEIFTDALERWDISAATDDRMPEYMKLSYTATLEFFDEVEENLAKGRSYCIEYAKKALLRQVRGYFHEAKWLHRKEIPTFDEYLPVGYQNAGSFGLISIAFTGMEDVTKESMDWVLSEPEPKIVRAMSTVGRLMNDIAYHKSVFRKSGRIVASAVECYIKQYDATEEEAVNELTKKVVDAWKDTNEDCLNPTIPRPLIRRVLDLVRTNDEMYRDGDGFTQDVLLKDMVDSLIINPVSV